MTVPLFLSRRFPECVRLCMASALLCLVLAPVFAQDEPTPADPPDTGQPPIAAETNAPDPDDPRLKEPIPGLMTEEPYAHWKRHVGTVEQAIALVTAQDSDGKTRQTTGLVVRCDGFVIAPLWIKEAYSKDKYNKDKPPILVTVAEAENETLKEPFPVVNRVYDGTNRCTYTVLKVNDHHIPCLPMLNGKNVSAGDMVRIVHAVADGPGKCKAVSVNAKVFRQTEAELAGRKDRWVLRASDGKPALTLETAPPGSIVVDEASGAAVGIVLEPSVAGAAAGEPVFSSFLYFYDVCADVGLMPDRAAIKEREGLPQWMSPEELAGLSARRKVTGMVWVPGGAVRLYGHYAAQYRSNYHTDIACTPGFFIAVNPVTNGEYRRWLATVPPPRRVPLGWDAPNDELANPRRDPSFPVLGVQPYDAQAYIAAQSQRLPTYVEWQRAAMSRNYQWADAMYRAMIDAYFRINHGLTSYLNFRDEHVEIERRLHPKVDNLTITAVGTDEYARTIDYLMLVIRNLVAMTGKALPSQSCDVNLRTDDVSIFGAANVLMNAPEMVLTPISQPTILAPKFRPARVDPYTSWVYHYDTGRRAARTNGKYPLDIAMRIATDPNSPPDFFLKYWTLIIEASVIKVGMGIEGASFHAQASDLDPDILVTFTSAGWGTNTDPGFRGAR